MNAPWTPRQRGLGAALALSLAATVAVAWWTPAEEDLAVVAATRKGQGAAAAVRQVPNTPAPGTAAPTPPPGTSDHATGGPRDTAPDIPADTPPPRSPWPTAPAAALAAWGVPAPAPTPAVEPAPEPAPPPAPKFPYTWIGRLDDGPEGSTVLLGGAQRSLGARVGDVLDGQWRVDRITRSALHLTWLPTGQATQLSSR